MATEKFKVTGRYEVGGAAPGQEVELDPDKVNVDELIRVGLVERVDQEPTTAVQVDQPVDHDEHRVVQVDRSGQTRSKARTTPIQSGSEADQ
ncbi:MULTISPECIES: hypothetical protein [unclassified Nonomuraea]|uniref:hypothetical protein n=1 Tax=unclassified Nonomuraea TaxID=2593643 RepID=UPI0033FE2C1D